MEDEIDLRPYIDSLRHKWYWIVSTAIIFGLLAFLVSSLLPAKYKATALIIVHPNDVVQFDPRFREASENQTLTTLPELANSDAVIQSVYTKLPISSISNVDQLRQILAANWGSNTSLIRLTVSYTDPELTAEIAATWANVLIEKVNDVYNDYGEDQVQFYEEQLIDAGINLSTLEEELVSFQSENRGAVISNTLQAYNQRQVDYLSIQNNAALLQRDAQALYTLLSDQTTDSNLTFADQLTALALQMKLFNLETSVPVLLQPGEPLTLTTESKSQQLALLENWLEILESQSLQASEGLASIEPLILDLQEQLQIINTEYDGLTRDLIIAQETYNALALKLEEEKIASQNTSRGISLASSPIVPNNPTGPNKMSNAIIAFFLGAFLAVFVIFTAEWWRMHIQT